MSWARWSIRGVPSNLEKIDALLRKACHLGTPENEADACAVSAVRMARREQVVIRAGALNPQGPNFTSMDDFADLVRRAATVASPRYAKAEPVSTNGKVFVFKYPVTVTNEGT